MFDRLIVSILRNDAKEPLFSVEERTEMLTRCSTSTPTWRSIRSTASRGSRRRALGYRPVAWNSGDFGYEYELQMALMNRRLSPQIETVFMMAHEAYSFISSRLVKEVFGLGGNITGLVPPSVERRLQARLSKSKIKGA